MVHDVADSADRHPYGGLDALRSNEQSGGVLPRGTKAGLGGEHRACLRDADGNRDASGAVGKSEPARHHGVSLAIEETSTGIALSRFFEETAAKRRPKIAEPNPSP